MYVIPLVKKEIVSYLIEGHNSWKQLCCVHLFVFLWCALINSRPPRSHLHQLVAEKEVVLRRKIHSNWTSSATAVAVGRVVKAWFGQVSGEMS